MQFIDLIYVGYRIETVVTLSIYIFHVRVGE